MIGRLNHVCRAVAVAATMILTPAAAASAAPHPLHLTRLVDPFIGTDGTGHTFPGASTPFAMVAPGPDNSDTGWDFASGYQHTAPTVMGFSNSHISGAGIGELGDVLIQPASGNRWSAATQDFSTPLDKASEKARPGYYAVSLPKLGVHVELTSTRTVAYHRYSFSSPGQAQALVDLQHVIRFLEGPRVVDADVRVDVQSGEISGRYRVRNWADRETAFVLKFDHPIASFATPPSTWRAPGAICEPTAPFPSTPPAARRTRRGSGCSTARRSTDRPSRSASSTPPSITPSSTPAISPTRTGGCGDRRAR